MKEIFRAKRDGQVMRKGYPMDMRIRLSPTGATLLGCHFGADISSIIKVHDDPQGGLVGVHVAPQAPLRVFCNVWISDDTVK